MTKTHDIDIKAVEHELCQRSFSHFIRRAWPHIIPDRYIHNWHVDAMAEHFEAVADGQISRLLINVPPGTSKSTITGIMYPAWLWGPKGQPQHKFIGAAHEQGLAVRDSRMMRELVASEWFQSLWPLKLAGDQNEKLFFENEKRGFRQACAVASMTGRRGHCLTGDSIIDTSDGPKSLKSIAVSASTCYVISYDIYSRKLVERQVQAVARGSSTEIYRVRSSSGRVVVCSGDHKFYTGRGYIEARLLSKGDSLVRALRNDNGSRSCRHEENGQDEVRGSILLSDVFDNLHEQQTWENRSTLYRVWEKTSERAAELFKRVQRNFVLPNRGEETRPEVHGSVQMVRSRDESAEVEHKEVLLKRLQGEASIYRDPRGKQPPMERRGGQEEGAAFRWYPLGVGGSADSSVGSRSWEVRRLRLRREHASAPYKHEQSGQPHGESGISLQRLPLRSTWRGQIEAQADSVAMVERIRGERDTYDLQVDGTNCFFANGILVHNSIVWDDPLSPEKAHSDTHRETAIRVLKETLPTRLSDPEKSAIIIIMQRLHENDPSGYILANESGYEHICLPMEFDPTRRCVTSLGWQDPRTEDGELLFPGRFPRAVVERDKKAMGEYGTAGQFQQLPSPVGGGIFKDEWWQYYSVLPKIKYRAIYADTAQKTKEQNDYSVFQCWGKGEDGRIYLIDMARGKWEAPELLVIAKAFWDKHKAAPRTMGTLRQFKVEDKASGTGLAQQLKQKRVPVLGIPRGTDKVTRAMDVVPQIQAGNVMLPESAPWLSDLLSETSGFPNAAHDDIVDPLMDAISDMLIEKQRPSYADIL